MSEANNNVKGYSDTEAEYMNGKTWEDKQLKDKKFMPLPINIINNIHAQVKDCDIVFTLRSWENGGVATMFNNLPLPLTYEELVNDIKFVGFITTPQFVGSKIKFCPNGTNRVQPRMPITIGNDTILDKAGIKQMYEDMQKIQGGEQKTIISKIYKMPLISAESVRIEDVLGRLLMKNVTGQIKTIEPPKNGLFVEKHRNDSDFKVHLEKMVNSILLNGLKAMMVAGWITPQLPVDVKPLDKKLAIKTAETFLTKIDPCIESISKLLGHGKDAAVDKNFTEDFYNMLFKFHHSQSDLEKVGYRGVEFRESFNELSYTVMSLYEQHKDVVFGKSIENGKKGQFVTVIRQ